MRAAVYHGQRDIRVESSPHPHPAADEVLIKVAVTGVCGTDAEEWASGPHLFPIDVPLIPGHEVAGWVVEMGRGVEGFSEGNLIAVGGGLSCGKCQWCRAGRTNLCERYSTVGLQRNGGLAEFVSVPSSICLDVASYGLTADVAALAQPMSIAVHAARRGGLQAEDTAVIVGVGGIGSFLAYAAKELGANVVALDIDATRVEQANLMGADLALDSSPEDAVVNHLADHGLVPDVVYEVSGTATGLETALQAATRGTRIVVVGLQDQRRSLDVRSLTLQEIDLIGTNAHVFAADFPEALRLLASRAEGWSDVAPIALPLDQVVEGALEPIANGTADHIKTLIDPSIEAPRATK